MRILYLELQNFLSYRFESIDFRQFSAPALSGENGAGKSAILDAITWVMFGRARGTDKRGRGSEKLLCDNISKNTPKILRVCLIFSLEKELYRIERFQDFTEKSNPQRISIKRVVREDIEDFSFSVFDEKGNELARSTLRKTNDFITKELLGMNYDAFVTSCFFLQNKYDSLMQKTTKERKEIIFEILGLNLFEIWKDRAKESHKNESIEHHTLVKRIEEVKERLKELDSLLNLKEELEAHLSTLKEEIERKKEYMGSLQSKVNQLDGELKKLSEINKDINLVEKKLGDLDKNLTKHKERLNDITTLIDKAEEIEQAYSNCVHETEQLENLTKVKIQRTEAENQELKLSKTIEKIELEHSDLKSKVESAISLSQHITKSKSELISQNEELKQLKQNKSAFIPSEQDINLLERKIEQFRVETEVLKTKIKRNEEKARLLDSSEAKCPICRQNLDEEVKTKLIDEIQGIIRGDTGEISSKEKKIVKTQDRLKKSQKEREKFLEQIDRLIKIVESRITAIETTLDLYRDGESVMNQKKEELNSFERESLPTLAKLKNQKAELQDLLEKLDFSEQEYEFLKGRKDHWKTVKEDHQKLVKATDSKENVEELLKHVAEKFQELTDDLTIKKEKISNVDKIKEEFIQEKDKLEEEVEVLKEKEEKKIQILGNLAVIDSKLEEINQMKNEMQLQEQELAKMKGLMENYTELEKMFGRDGIPTLILENSIPEIERETQRVLNHITNGTMKIRIETQKQLKTKNKKREVLDILIKTGKTIRPSEMLSGGELYRLNFAFRLALSHMLTRRAGRKLQTLIIDEGFGSQDTNGRKELLKILTRLQTWFESIIVISHIEEIRDYFPQQILIEKTPEEGSKVVEVSTAQE